MDIHSIAHTWLDGGRKGATVTLTAGTLLLYWHGWLWPDKPEEIYLCFNVVHGEGSSAMGIIFQGMGCCHISDITHQKRCPIMPFLTSGFTTTIGTKGVCMTNWLGLETFTGRWNAAYGYLSWDAHNELGGHEALPPRLPRLHSLIESLLRLFLCLSRGYPCRIYIFWGVFHYLWMLYWEKRGWAVTFFAWIIIYVNID